MFLAAAAAALAAVWPRGSRQLVVYSMMGPAHALTAAFTARTGIAITYVNLDGGPMQARLYAEGDHPRWTLAWFTGEAPMAALDASGLLARHAAGDPDWPDRAPFTDLARSLLPADRAWLPTRIGLGAAFVTAAGAPRPDADAGPGRQQGWQQAWSGAQSLGLLSPASSGAAYPVLATILAVAGAQGRAMLLAARPRLRVFASSPSLFAALRSGDVALAVLPSETAFALRRRDPALAVALPAPNTLLPDVIGLSARADPTQRAQAARFVAFVLSAEGQALLGQDTAAALGWPPVASVAADPALPPLPPGALHLPPAPWGAAQDREIGWFERELAR